MNLLISGSPATWRHPFTVKWRFQNDVAERLRTCCARYVPGNSAFVLPQRKNEQTMTSDFRENLVALLPRLRRFALTLTANLDQADDLVQQACEKALLKQAQWQEGTRLDSWLYRIIQNLHIDLMRSQGRRSEHLHDDSVDDLVDARSKGQPERENMLSVLSRLIHELPEDQRVVMLLVAVEEHSYREAAAILEVPVGTVMSRLARARTRIMAMLDEPAVPAAGGRGNA
jgi:RNA polymerase sigma-70 factor (ECF subfamily)